MNYVGVDIHKKYSVFCAVDEVGKKVREGRVEGNSEKALHDSLPVWKARAKQCWKRVGTGG
jgi:hypothetical protein